MAAEEWGVRTAALLALYSAIVLDTPDTPSTGQQQALQGQGQGPGGQALLEKAAGERDAIMLGLARLGLPLLGLGQGKVRESSKRAARRCKARSRVHCAHCLDATRGGLSCSTGIQNKRADW